MCCLTQDPANPYTVAIIDCCTLKIQNADGTLIDTFNLLDLDYQVANGILYLKDGVNTRTINVADAPAIFGVADMAAVLAFIDLAVNTCKCDPPVIPVTLDVLNCDGTTTPTTFDSEPAKVEIVQTKPLIICKSSVDFEIGCSSVDGRIVVRTYTQDENGVITSQIFEQDGVTPAADGSILVKCDMDIEDVEFCFQDITDTSIRYRQVLFVNTATNAVVSTIWLDGTGAAIVAPTNIEPCGEVTAVPHVSGCIKRSLGQLACVENVQTFLIPSSGWGTITIDANDGNGNYLITQTLTTPADAAVYAAMIAAAGTPNTRISEDINGGFIINFWNGNIGNVTQVSPTSFQYEYFIEPGATDTPSALPSPCVDPVGNQAYIDTATLLRGAFDSYGIGNPSPNGGDITFVITTYGTNTVPGGGIEVIHAKQIVTKNVDGSYEERYYSTGDINTEIIFNPATDTFSTNCDCKKEIFATHIKYYLQPANKVWTLFSKLEPIHPDAGSYGSSFIIIGDQITGTHPGGPYVGNDINGWFVYSMVSPTQPANDSNGHYWIQGQPSSFSTVTFNRINPDIAFSASEICTPIQEIKEKDTCTGEETYRYVIENGNGNLVPVTDIYPSFTEADVLYKCGEQVLADHQNGCIKRAEVTQICNTQVSVFNFGPTDFVQFTIIANDGNGNYTIQQEMTASAKPTLLTVAQLMAQDNTRTAEDIGGFIQLNYWEGNFTNVLDISATTIQFDVHLQPGVSDIPDALITPCADSVPDATYQSSAALLKGIYDAAVIGDPNPNGGNAIEFTITQYSQILNPTGNYIYIPAKQVVTYDIDGNPITDKYYEPSTLTEITYDTTTDVFSNECSEQFDIKEKDVCVTIDGSTESYEAIKVYKRSRTSGLATLIHYETKAGDVINGTIAEVCCTCETLCDVPTSASNKVAFGYATLFNGSWVAGDRITGGEELYLDYLEVDGNILVNSPRPLGSTTGGFTATDMGYGIGYNKIVDLLNTVPEFAANGVRFVTAAAPFAPNGTSYDPMMWGVEYDDTKDVRIVLRDKLLISGSSHSYSIRLNPDPAQTYDALMNVVTSAANDWDINNVSNYTQPMLLQNITAI